jgi:argininosuccinate lyase
MPGYTHYRHAQPTTLGHYLLSVFDPIERIMRNLERAYGAMSLNELGCGALAGTSWPIDRELVCAYLGLDGSIENANDAVAYTDGYVDVVSGLTNLMAVVSRLSLDLNIWSTPEYGFMNVPWVGGRGKAHSYFMPNKTANVPFLERARVGAAQVLGTLVEVATMGIRVPHGDHHEMLHMEDGTVRALEFTHTFLHPLLYTLPRIEVYPEGMLADLRVGYSCATELANHLMRHHDLDYRTAHELVYEFVTESKKRGVPSHSARIDLFEAAARKALGREVGLAEEELRIALDPLHFLEVTTSRGGIAPAETERMLADRRKQLAQARERQGARVERLEKAQARLTADLEGLV